ncbi:BLUF domain-containing protein [Catalinimonas niigatensis]|uniref:BLUF domain-containing protein n=1 Tax=Catalinimonas niigatensis TaxID=1397264 RepID=UPI002665D906|nr:BLUF domain-containing protein [Catalinimonas niigatensis]WPP50328.1 BLUF domain-containing protein [Catalinimonas niigatensis]
MLSQLVYVSVRNPSCTEEEIQKILAACKRNNKEKDVTGVLLYSNTHFVQYLEGEYSKISSLYDKIKTDSRHKNAIMINTAPIQERSFPSWQMGAKKFDNDEITYQTDMSSSEKVAFKSLLSGKESNNLTIGLIKKFFK